MKPLSLLAMATMAVAACSGPTEPGFEPQAGGSAGSADASLSGGWEGAVASPSRTTLSLGIYVKDDGEVIGGGKLETAAGLGLLSVVGGFAFPPGADPSVQLQLTITQWLGAPGEAPAVDQPVYLEGTVSDGVIQGELNGGAFSQTSIALRRTTK